MNKYLTNPKFLAFFILALTVPAMLINLGLEQLIDDEGIRGLVSLEMDLRHNFITPTLGGESYFNKPPVYNWVLLGFFHLFGSFSNFALRFPTVIFVYLFSLVIFLFTRKPYGNRMGFLVAMSFLTCGRELFYDSFKGLIDTSFSLLIFSSFLAIYHFSKKEKYLTLFALSYFLTALAFLMKGIPALAFQGITLVTWFFIEKKVKHLFSIHHVLGGFLFLLIIGGYYLLYYFDNSQNLNSLLHTLLNESAQKSVVGAGIWPGILHIFTFPVELIYHFLPWTLFVVYLFKKGVRKTLWADPILRFFLIVFLANITVYWVSPVVYARYLFMFVPLAFLPLFVLHRDNETEGSLHYRLINIVLLIIIGVGVVASPVAAFIEATKHLPYATLKSAVLFFSFVFVFIGYLKVKQIRIELVMVALLLARIGFDWFIIPARYNESIEGLVKMEIQQICQATKGERLYYDVDPQDFKFPEMFHITVLKKDLMKMDTAHKNPGFYLIHDTTKIRGMQYERLGLLHAESMDRAYTFVKIK